MHIKPECDVETAEDFAKYYDNSFMESRDGRVLRVVGHHGRNVVLRDFFSSAPEHDETYTMLPWRQVQTDLVYGRPAAGAFIVENTAFFLYMPNNRQAGRGFQCGYYSFYSLRRKEPITWRTLDEEHKIARAVFKPEYFSLEEAIQRAERQGHDSLLDPRYTVVRTPGGVELFRGSRSAGKFNEGGTSVFLGKGMKFCEHALRNILNYKGVIRYDEAA